MFSNKSNFLIFSTIFIILGILSLYGSVAIVFDENAIKKGFIVCRSSNFLIKYSPSITLLFAGLGCIFSPPLVVKYKISLGNAYREGSKFEQAKSNLLFIIVFLPTVIYFSASIYFSGSKINNYPLFIIVVVVLFFIPMQNIYNYFKHKDQNITSH